MIFSLSGYDILDQIHSSGQSNVYRALRLSDSKPVVLKTAGADHPSRKTLRKLKREQRLLTSFNHPLIVKCYDLVRNRHNLVLVIEDISGVPLTQTPQMDVEDILELSLEVVEGLAYLHQQQVVHKDINPSNIIVNPETGDLRIIDFGISSVLAREDPLMASPQNMEGTLGYISPEQTGRMNRTVDYRTDFYSLGATLYQLLTGKLPFDTQDPMEMVHCHIARIPKSPSEVNQALPEALSDVLMKLLAKNAEERYQSAYGLKYDLEHIFRMVSKGQTGVFAIGSHDHSDHFTIPEKLYGREGEIANLMRAFERASRENAELILVSGPPGIGKSSLVNEIHKPIVQKKGYFITGKFDQFKRNIPYASVVEAFRALIRQILAETADRIEETRIALLEALGDNGQVVIEVIPEVELIIGEQHEVPVLPAAESLNRFNLVFQNFVSVFAKASHPLVLFLDDLQWADTPSLKLIEMLLYGSRTHHMLMIGAYRDNEVSPAHPMAVSVKKIVKAEVNVQDLQLGPLDFGHIQALLNDALHQEPHETRLLAELCLEKTGGNPFFLNQFLLSLHREQLIFFNRERGAWQWDVLQIDKRQMTDNVIELMVNDIRKLSAQTQEVLKLAACIGNTFVLSVLSLVCEQEPHETANALWDALERGLILPRDHEYKFTESEVNPNASYRFLHDRVQQAADSLIKPEEKTQIHLRIGRLLLKHLPKDHHEDRLFEIVNHLNHGADLFTDPNERLEVARLNLSAGRKARDSAAHEPALAHFHVGLRLLPEDAWTAHYLLALELHVEAARAAYLAANFEEMEILARVVLEHADNLLDRLKAYRVKIDALIAQNALVAAIHVALPLLAELGVAFPENATQKDIVLELMRTKLSLAGKDFERFADLPAMTDPYKLAAMNLMSALFSATYLGMPNLFPIFVLRVVRLSLKYGVTSVSAFGFACYGLVLCGVLGDMKQGGRFADLALKLLDRLESKDIKTRTLFVVYAFVRHWREHLATIPDPLLETFRSVLESGDHEYAAHAVYMRSVYLYLSGENLPTLDYELARYADALTRMKQETTLHYNNICHQTVQNLMSSAKEPWKLIGARYDETTTLQAHHEANDHHALFNFHMQKMILNYLFGRMEEAVAMGEEAQRHIEGVLAFPQLPFFSFYMALALLGHYPKAPKGERGAMMKAVDRHLKKLKKWEKHAPMNHRHKVALVKAERARIQGKEYETAQLYDAAITGAAEQGYLREEALANELASGFYFERGRPKVAQAYLWDAVYCYDKWGALAKIRRIEARYPDLIKMTPDRFSLRNAAARTVTVTTEKISEALDLASVIKTSQAISGEIRLDQLIRKMIQIVIENAGAQRGVLLLQREGALRIAAEGGIEREPQIFDNPLLQETEENLSVSIVSYVARTGENVVLNNAALEGTFTTDAYIAKNQTRSVLCMPLINQGKLVGILYLENNLAGGAFTAQRIEILRVLSSQITISIENARLYADLEDYSKTLETKVDERTRELSAKNEELVATQKQLILQEKMASLGTLTAGIAHEIKNPLNFVNNFSQVNVELCQELLEETAEVAGSTRRDEYASFQEIIKDLVDNSTRILRHGNRANSILQSMMLLSKSGAVKRQSTSINKLLEEYTDLAYQGMKANTKRTDVTFVRDLADNLPAIEAVPQNLGRVFLNLINNALDSLFEKRERLGEAFKPVIQLKTQREDETHVRVTIRDNGKGIPEKNAGQIFNPFFTTKPTGTGNIGLGLSISYDIVTQEHGGDMRLVSEEGEFAEFIITLPIRHNDEQRFQQPREGSQEVARKKPARVR